MTPDEVVKVLEGIQKWHEDGVSSESKRRPEWLYQNAALSSAISIIQDYQKLRERVSVEKISKLIADSKYVGMVKHYSICKEWADTMSQAIVTYLQQPTEPIVRLE